ncbi:hypothetical protein ACFE04_014106 [Oxalis oulophora]
MGLLSTMFNSVTPAILSPIDNENLIIPQWRREKVVVILGATGTGKSKLSISLSTKFPAEIINSDKMQVHRGLDILTNKVTQEEMCGVPHHLLGILEPNADLTAPLFCNMASQAIESIISFDKLPIIVGGSNNFVEALVDGEDRKFGSHYDCCFLWVDVALPILRRSVSERVDVMVKRGMIDEARMFFDPRADNKVGIRKSIGVRELEFYFRVEKIVSEAERQRLLGKAVEEIKDNTYKLVCTQLEKIHRLQNVKKWGLHRLDATEVFLRDGKEADEAWEKFVGGPSTAIVAEFLRS